MFLTTVFLLTFLLATPISAAEESPDTRTLLEVVFSYAILPDLIRDWEIPPDRDYVVLSDRSILFDFPQSAQQRLEEEELNKRVFRDVNNPDWKEYEKVDWGKLWYGNPDPCCDFVLPEGHVIPKSIVALALKAKDGVALPAVSCLKPLKVILEDSQFIDHNFKRPTDGTDAFARKYPKVAAIMQITLPVFNADRTMAGLYYTAVPTRFGGHGEFILLERVGDSWVVKWTHTVWFE